MALSLNRPQRVLTSPSCRAKPYSSTKDCRRTAGIMCSRTNASDACATLSSTACSQSSQRTVGCAGTHACQSRCAHLAVFAQDRLQREPLVRHERRSKASSLCATVGCGNCSSEAQLTQRSLVTMKGGCRRGASVRRSRSELVGSALRAKHMAPDLCAQHRRQRSLLQRRQAVPRCTVRDAKYEATAAAHTVRPWPRASQQCTRTIIGQRSRRTSCVLPRESAQPRHTPRI